MSKNIYAVYRSANLCQVEDTGRTSSHCQIGKQHLQEMVRTSKKTAAQFGRLNLQHNDPCSRDAHVQLQF